MGVAALAARYVKNAFRPLPAIPADGSFAGGPVGSSVQIWDVGNSEKADAANRVRGMPYSRGKRLLEWLVAGRAVAGVQNLLDGELDPAPIGQSSAVSFGVQLIRLSFG